MGNKIGKAEVGSDGFIPTNEIKPLQNKQKYFSTPAKNNSVGYTGNLSAIGKEDFMLEVVCNMENGQLSNYSLFRIIGVTSSMYSQGSLSIYNTEANSNSINYILFGNNNSVESVENSINPYKTFPKSKLIHIVIGRSGTSAWAIVNGVKYSKTQSEVLEISNKVTIANAKKFARLRKFNFADEGFAMKLWNNGDWDGVRIGDEWRTKDSILIVDLNISLCELWASKGTVRINDNTFSRISGSESWDFGIISSDRFINKSFVYKIKIKGSNTNAKTYIRISNPNNGNEIKRTQILPIGDFYEELLLDNLKDIENLDGRLGVKFYGLQGSDECTIRLDYLIIIKCAIQDEFLPSSFTKYGAINLAGGENLTAMKPENITFGYDQPYSDTIISPGVPNTIPDFTGQICLNTATSKRYIALNTTSISDWKLLK